jgi:hypothetical protein
VPASSYIDPFTAFGWMINYYSISGMTGIIQERIESAPLLPKIPEDKV